MVAGVAAGAAALIRAPHRTHRSSTSATADEHGEALASDVIAGIDWILANKAQYDIRVANLSLAATRQTSFQSDPLDKAVEKLWFSGVVVVAAAGNQRPATGEVVMSAAPGNDPFVITVGAIDQTADLGDRRRLVAPVVGVRPHGGRLREAGALGAGPLPRRCRCRPASTIADRAARARRLARLHVDVRHVVRGPGRLRRGGAATRAPARPGRPTRSRAR